MSSAICFSLNQSKILSSVNELIIFSISDDTDYHCPHPNVRCEKETIRMCLRPEQMCDGNKDCDDDTDEGRMCKGKRRHHLC